MKKAARLGAIVPGSPPGLIECADGNWSTATQGGFCSYHGGAVLTKKKATKKAPAKASPGIAPAPPPSLPAPERLPEPEPQELPDIYWKIDSQQKAEVHFEYRSYKGLSDEIKKWFRSYFLWSRPRQAWVSKGMWRNVADKLKALNIPLLGRENILSVEDQLERKTSFAERRADRREAQADKAQQRAAQLMEARERYRGDWNFWTQPNINSSAGRAFKNQRERIINNYFRGLTELEKADRLRELAADARLQLKNKKNTPLYVKYKMDEARTSVRKLSEWVPDYMKEAAESGDLENIIQAEAYQDRLNKKAEEFYYWSEIYSSLSDDIYTKEKLSGAEYVKRRNDWHKVLRLNPTTVTHSWFVGTGKSPYEEIDDAVFKGESYKVAESNIKGSFIIQRQKQINDNQPGIAPPPVVTLPAPERLPDPEPVTVMPPAAPTTQADVVLMPVQAISIRRDWFQNRTTPYSERSVSNIIAAVQNGTFNWVNMDPVTLWAAGDGKTYMLSGHSRLEAFERLCKMGAEVDGRNFCAIPAKVAYNLSLEQARQIALESNTLSTKESDLERAEFYRKARQVGKSEQSIKEDAKRLEGQNWTTIYAISFLAPTGKMMTALNALEKGDATSRGNAFTIARWIGNARAAVKSLTDRHENEIYDWLITGKGYGTKTGQVSNEREFSNRLTSIINRRSEWGVLAESLNIQNNITLSPVERQYNEELQQAAQVLRDLERDINNTLRSYKARGATDTELMNVTAGTQAALARARINYTNLLQKKSDVTQYAKQEKGLFDELSGIKKRRSLFNYYL